MKQLELFGLMRQTSERMVPDPKGRCVFRLSLGSPIASHTRANLRCGLQWENEHSNFSLSSGEGNRDVPHNI